MSTIAVIPARGGSKGIPGKNIIPFAGKPLLAHTIEQALAADSIDRVIVSTNDAEIRDVALAHGAEVVLRPESISSDTSTSEAALLHVLDELKEKEGFEPDSLVFLQATSPLRTPEQIEGAIQQFQSEQADSLFSASPMNGFFWRLYKEGPKPLNYDHTARPMRQQIEQDVVENGSLYIMKTSRLRESSNRLGGKISVYLMDPLYAFQIDEPEDVGMLETLRHLLPAGESLVDWNAVRLLVLDFDGVFTDNSVFVDQEAVESVRVSRSDGWGLARLRDAGVEALILSTEENPVVKARANKLMLEVYHGVENKLTLLQQLVQDRKLEPGQVAFIGNDVNDRRCLEWVGLPIVVADAYPQVKPLARYVTEHEGGKGAIREVCDLIIQSQTQNDKSRQ